MGFVLLLLFYGLFYQSLRLWAVLLLILVSWGFYSSYLKYFLEAYTYQQGTFINFLGPMQLPKAKSSPMEKIHQMILAEPQAFLNQPGAALSSGFADRNDNQQGSVSAETVPTYDEKITKIQLPINTNDSSDNRPVEWDQVEGKLSRCSNTGLELEAVKLYLGPKIYYAAYAQIALPEEVPLYWTRLALNQNVLLSDLKSLPPQSPWDSVRLTLGEKTTLWALGQKNQKFVPAYYYAIHRVDVELSGQSASILKAFIYNYWQNFDEEFRHQTSVLGIFHLFSISGLHLFQIMFLVYVIAWLGLATIFRPERHPKIRLICRLVALGSGFFYVWFLGFPLPALRSVLFLALWLTSLYVLPYYPRILRLIFCLLVFLSVSPSSIGDLSLVLTFLGVLGLHLADIAMLFWNHQARLERSLWVYKLLQLFLASVFVNIVCFPIFFLYFQTFNPSQPLNNIAHILFSTWVLLPLGLLILPISLLAYTGWQIPGEHYLYVLLGKLLNFWASSIRLNYSWVKDYTWPDFGSTPLYYWLWAFLILGFCFFWLGLEKKLRKQARSQIKYD